MLATCKSVSGKGKEYTTPFLEDFHLGYITGLLDGEGCFHVSEQPKGTSYYVAIYNTNKDLLQYVLDILEVGSIMRSGDNEKRGYKPCWVWKVQTLAGSFAVASMFEPVLLVKKEAARKLISTLKDRVEVIE